MHIGKHCQQYRKSKNASLQVIAMNDNIKTLSAFENGRSTNVRHFIKYAQFALSEGELDIFMKTVLAGECK